MAKRKRTRLYILLVVVVAALIAGAIYKSKTRDKGEEVETAKVEKRTIVEMVSASGKIFPEKEVVISSDVSGEVVELLVEEGDSIVSGQLLARIDPEAYESAVERGEAAVNSAKAQLAISRANVQNAIALGVQSGAQFANAKRVFERNKKLFDQGVISESEYETSLADFEATQANLDASKASENSARENVKANEFAVKSAEASLKELGTSLRKTTIFAPVDGIISKLDIEEGERVVGTIQMAGTEMMRIANLSIMEVQVDVSENDILKVAEYDSTDIEVDAYLDRKFKGVVTEIANSASSIGTTASLTTDQVTNFVVKIRMVPNSYADLITADQPFPFRPGMSASVDIKTNAKEDVLALPILAVTTRDVSKKDEEVDEDESEETDVEEVLNEVVFLCKGDTLHMQQVVTGIQDDTYIHITEGVSEGDEVVSGPYSVVTRKLNQGDNYTKKEKGKKKS